MNQITQVVAVIIRNKNKLIHNRRELQEITHTFSAFFGNLEKTLFSAEVFLFGYYAENMEYE